MSARQLRSDDVMSMVNFEPEFIERLIALGEEDTEARIGEIAAFLDGAPSAG